MGSSSSSSSLMVTVAGFCPVFHATPISVFSMTSKPKHLRKKTTESSEAKRSCICLVSGVFWWMRVAFLFNKNLPLPPALNWWTLPGQWSWLHLTPWRPESQQKQGWDPTVLGICADSLVSVMQIQIITFILYMYICIYFDYFILSLIKTTARNKRFPSFAMHTC